MYLWQKGKIFWIQCWKINKFQPFGNNQSQQEILERKTIVNANEGRIIKKIFKMVKQKLSYLSRETAVES